MWRVLDRDQGVVFCVEHQGPPLDLPPLPLVSQAVRRADADPGPPHEQNRDWPSLLNTSAARLWRINSCGEPLNVLNAHVLNKERRAAWKP